MIYFLPFRNSHSSKDSEEEWVGGKKGGKKGGKWGGEMGGGKWEEGAHQNIYISAHKTNVPQ